MRIISFALALALFGVPGDERDDARAITERALAAMGVSRDVRQLRSLRAEVNVVNAHLMDSDHPEPPHLLDFGEGTVSDDFVLGASLTEMRTAAATGAVVEASALNEGELVQSVVVYDGRRQPPHGSAAPPNWDLSNPIRALRAALAAPDLHLEKVASLRGVPVHVVSFAHGDVRVRLFLSDETNLPIAVESEMALRGDIAWRPRGDLRDRTEFSNWNLVSGLRYPFQWDTSRNGVPLRTTMITALQVDLPLDAAKFAASEAARAELDLPGRRDTDDLPLGRPDRPIAEISPGVIQIPGGWYVTLVRQSDGVVVIDAPVSNGYSSKVIAEASRRFPGLPIKAVITTTSFGWHFAGLREYAARGIPIYLLDRNGALVRNVLTAPHRLDPDSLSLHEVTLKLHLVAGRTVIGEGDNQLVIYPIRRGTGQMLMTYIPSARMLHTAEMVQPLGPAGEMLFPESLLEIDQAVRDAGIPVETIIGMHMSPTSWRRVSEAVRRES